MRDHMIECPPQWRSLGVETALMRAQMKAPIIRTTIQRAGAPDDEPGPARKVPSRDSRVVRKVTVTHRGDVPMRRRSARKGNSTPSVHSTVRGRRGYKYILWQVGSLKDQSQRFRTSHIGI